MDRVSLRPVPSALRGDKTGKPRQCRGFPDNESILSRNSAYRGPSIFQFGSATVVRVAPLMYLVLSRYQTFTAPLE